MSLIDVLFGKPLASWEDAEQKVGTAAGVPIFGLDALGSAAYGPEAALTMLLPLGAIGVAYIVPISSAIIVLLAIVYLSYRQTIAAYPSGAGSYTVAKQNLGPRFGLLAASALMIDYVLNVAVGISAGIGAVVSAIPSLQPFTLRLCLGVLLLLTIVNLRGVREAGVLFMLPTYLFVATMLGAIGLGVGKAILSGGHPIPVEAPPKPHAAAAAVGAWLLIKAFSSGCTAMTGVEAVSNGVQAFGEPVVTNARRTLTIIIGILMILLAGVAYLVNAYGIVATEPGSPAYRSVLSMLLACITGRGVYYYVAIASILMVLSLSANTSFAAFPRLCRVVAQDNYLPVAFASRGRRLVYSHGVYVLAALSGGLLIVFGGVTDRLIPLFAVGAFMAFTLSQAGMVMHWRKQAEHGSRSAVLINSVGALVTGATVLVVMAAKFKDGAWITLVMVPGLLILMTAVRRHYKRVWAEIKSPTPLELNDLRPPVVVVPVDTWSRVSKKALRFAMTLSSCVKVIHIDCGEDEKQFKADWESWVVKPAEAEHRTPPELVVLPSPFRFVVGPIVNYVLELENQHKDRQIAVVVSELVERRWYHYLLHNQRAQVLTAILALNGDRRIVVVNVPWYLTA